MSPKTYEVLRRKAESDPRYRALLERAGRPPTTADMAADNRRQPPTFARAPGRINVGFLVPVAKLIGGAERVCHDLGRALDPARFAVAGIALQADPIETISALCRAADVLIVWGIRDWPNLLQGPSKPAIILTAHGSGPWAADSVSRAAEADALVAVGPACVEPFPWAERARVRVIPNMVDPARVVANRSRDEVRAAWGVPDDAHVALFLGRLSGEKRPGVALEAALAAEGLYVVLCGQGALRDELAALAATTPGAVLAGECQDVGSALAAADCLILPSETEGCSLAGLEGHLAGLPVIATPVGLYATRPDLARIVPPMCSAEELRRAILDDREDWYTTTARVDRARAYVRENHHPIKFRSRWEETIRAVAPPQPPPPPPRVGDAFARRVEALGFHAGNCRCNATRARMNDLGVEGSEAHFEELVDEVKANARSMHAAAALLPKAAIRATLRAAIADARGADRAG